VWLDGYNVLTLLESALAGSVVLLGRDGCCRDIAGIHRRYRKVNETAPVTADDWWKTVGGWESDVLPLVAGQAGGSNSGRLKTFIGEVAAAADWNMPVGTGFQSRQGFVGK